MKTGAAIALGVGGFIFLSRQQAAAQTAAARASSPVGAAANGITALENSLLSLLKPSAKPPSSAAPKSAGGSGFNPAGGAGSGRSAGGTTPSMPVENAFDVFPNFNGPSVIDQGPTGAAFQPGGIFSDPTQFAGNEPDFTAVAPDPSAENSLIDSLAQSSSGAPIFQPDPDPSEIVPIDPSIGVDDGGEF